MTANNHHSQQNTLVAQPHTSALNTTSFKSKRPEDIEAKPSIVGLNYRVQKKIGEGSFGVIYEGVHVLERQPVAIKFESKKSVAPQLRDEYRTYRILAGSVGIPNAYYFGHESLYYCLVIDLLGSSLEELFNICSRRFTLKTVAMLAKQMISRIQTIHEKNLIYRDIKPDNFLVGRGSKDSSIFIVDFGMAKHYRDPKTKKHIVYRERKSLSGTARYMSINTHLGREQSRRDDLEALGHVFFYFLRGSLPWQGLRAANNKEKYEKIGEKKQTTPIAELCEGLPEEFGEYLRYARSLGFEETPNYDYLRSLMDSVLKRAGEVEDFVFDWITIKKKKESFSIGGIVEDLGPPRAPQIPALDEGFGGPGHHNYRYSGAATGPHSQHYSGQARSPNFSDRHHHNHQHPREDSEAPPGHRQRKKPGFFARIFCPCFSKGPGGGGEGSEGDSSA